MKVKQCLFTSALILLAVDLCFSQWSTDPSQNLRVTTMGLLPKIISDGAGGAYILYKDLPLEHVHLYFQRLDKYGYRKFPGNGIQLADSNRYQRQYYNLISDDHNGALVGYHDVIIVGEDDYIYNAHVQRIDSIGNKLWGDNGVLIDKGGEPFVHIVSLCSNENGGCYVFWGRYFDRNHIELWAQHLDNGGNFLWDSSGVLISDQFVSFNSPIPCLTASDENGGFLCEFIDSTGVKVQRINPLGEKMWQNGVTLSSIGGWANIMGDGSGGVIIVSSHRSYYDEHFGWHYNVVAQRIDKDGNILWEEGGIVITDSADNQTHKPELNIDKEGNSFIVWADRRTKNSNVYSQKLNSEGLELWEKNGILIGNLKYTKNVIENGIVVDNMGGIIIIWRICYPRYIFFRISLIHLILRRLSNIN